MTVAVSAGSKGFNHNEYTSRGATEHALLNRIPFSIPLCFQPHLLWLWKGSYHEQFGSKSFFLYWQRQKRSKSPPKNRTQKSLCQVDNNNAMINHLVCWSPGSCSSHPSLIQILADQYQWPNENHLMKQYISRQFTKTKYSTDDLNNTELATWNNYLLLFSLKTNCNILQCFWVRKNAVQSNMLKAFVSLFF